MLLLRQREKSGAACAQLRFRWPEGSKGRQEQRQLRLLRQQEVQTGLSVALELFLRVATLRTASEEPKVLVLGSVEVREHSPAPAPPEEDHPPATAATGGDPRDSVALLLRQQGATSRPS